MPVTDKIFDRLDILQITFKGPAEYECEWLSCVRKKEGLAVEAREPVEGLDSLERSEKKVPCVVVFCGYGVISKDREALPAQLLEKVVSNDGEFLWDEEGGVITLLRMEQAEPLMELTGQSKLRCVGTVVSAGAGEEQVLAAADKYAEKTFKLGRLLQPDTTGSVLCGILISKIKLPFLALMLALLVANYFRGEDARAEYASLRIEADAYERAVGAAGLADRQKADLIGKYTSKIPHGFSWIADRVALAMPRSVLLSSLRIQPVLKKNENGKELLIDERKVEISGQGFNAEDITLFVTALTRLEFAREVKMVSLEQNRNTGELEFRLMLEL